MNKKISKANEKTGSVRARLDRIQMSDHDRLLAETQLAGAEAAVEVAADLIGLGKRLLRALVLRPFRRFTATAG